MSERGLSRVWTNEGRGRVGRRGGQGLGHGREGLDLRKEVEAGLASRLWSGSQDAAGVRGLLGGDGASVDSMRRKVGKTEGRSPKADLEGRGRPRTGAGLPLPARGGGSGSGCGRPAPAHAAPPVSPSAQVPSYALHPVFQAR